MFNLHVYLIRYRFGELVYAFIYYCYQNGNNNKVYIFYLCIIYSDDVITGSETVTGSSIGFKTSPSLADKKSRT